MTIPLLVRWMDFLHAIFGYRFPRLGTHARNGLFAVLPRTAEVTLLPSIRTPAEFRDLTMRAWPTLPAGRLMGAETPFSSFDKSFCHDF